MWLLQTIPPIRGGMDVFSHVTVILSVHFLFLETFLLNLLILSPIQERIRLHYVLGPHLGTVDACCLWKLPCKGKRLSCNGEGKVHCFCILFLGPKSCCKFCSIKTRPCCLLSVLPPPLAFPASQYYWLRILKQYNTGLYYFEWKSQRWEIFSCVLCLA